MYPKRQKWPRLHRQAQILVLLVLEPEQMFCTQAEAVPKRAKPEGLAGKLWNVVLGLPFLREWPFLTPERGRGVRLVRSSQAASSGRGATAWPRSAWLRRQGWEEEGVRGLWESKPVSSLSSLSVFPLTMSPFLLSADAQQHGSCISWWQREPTSVSSQRDEGLGIGRKWRGSWGPDGKDRKIKGGYREMKN